MLGCASGTQPAGAGRSGETLPGSITSTLSGETIEAKLERVDLALSNNRQQDAQRLLVEILNNKESFWRLPSQQQFHILDLFIDLSAKANLAEAIEFLESFSYTDGALTAQINLLLWDLYLRNSDFIAAIEILEQLGDRHFLPPPRVSSLIWQSLFVQGAIHAIDWKNTHDQSLTAWGELADLYRSNSDSESLGIAFESWRQRHPQHRAALYPPFEIRSSSSIETSPAELRRVGVILPKDGQYAAAATAIQDGFLLAYMNQGTGKGKSANLIVNFYDSYRTNPVELLNKVFADGTDLAAGFIDKANVASVLHHQQSFPGPVMLLNRNDTNTATPGNVLQFALAIDDEIEAIVTRLNNDSLRRVVVFAGNHDWAIRARNRFLTGFESEQNKVVSQAFFDEPASIIDVVGVALDVQKSIDRLRELERLTRSTYEFTPRRRLDIDAIVAFVDEIEFNSMLAALNYHYASDVPLFVTETAVRSGETSEFESSVFFTTTPWLIEDSLLERQVDETFNPSTGAKSLYAFGIDVLRIAGDWDEFIDTGWIVGSSGTFRVAQDGTIVRNPVWGEVNNQTFQASRKQSRSKPSSTYLNLPRTVQ